MSAQPFPDPSQVHFRREPWLIGAALVSAPAILFSVLMLLGLTRYETGEEVGTLMAGEERGLICRTYEGRLARAPGEPFAFSVHDPAVAAEVAALTGRRVELTYEDHRHLPTTCYGETEYTVTAVREVGDEDVGAEARHVTEDADPRYRL